MTNEIPEIKLAKSYLISDCRWCDYAEVEEERASRKARDLALAQQLPELCGDCRDKLRGIMAAPAEIKCFDFCPTRLVKEALSK